MVPCEINFLGRLISSVTCFYLIPFCEHIFGYAEAIKNAAIFWKAKCHHQSLIKENYFFCEGQFEALMPVKYFEKIITLV
jgi:hypothetical protein